MNDRSLQAAKGIKNDKMFKGCKKGIPDSLE